MRLGKTRLIKIILLMGLLMGSFTSVIGQDIDGLIELIELGKVDSARSLLADLSYENPGHPGVRYARALLQDDALVAAGLYKDIVRNHRNSQYAPSAIMHLGEYYYAQGLYIQSRQYFSRLIRFHPDHKDIINAVNMSLRAGIASRQMDSVYIDLAAIIERFPNLAFDIPEELDLTRIPSRQSAEFIPDDTPQSPPPIRGLGQGVIESEKPAQSAFSLQAGAFSSYDNAKRLADQIESIGYTTRLKERSSGNSVLYLIMVGDYETKTAASSVADMLEAALGVESFPVAND